MQICFWQTCKSWLWLQTLSRSWGPSVSNRHPSDVRKLEMYLNWILHPMSIFVCLWCGRLWGSHKSQKEQEDVQMNFSLADLFSLDFGFHNMSRCYIRSMLQIKKAWREIPCYDVKFIMVMHLPSILSLLCITNLLLQPYSFFILRQGDL